MSTHYSPRIVTDGLVLYLDAANPKSYPGTGTDWFDLSGNGNDGTLYNVTHLPLESNGVIQTNGVNTSYANVPLNLYTSNFTVIVSSRYKPGATIKGRTLSGALSNWALGHHSNSSPDFYSDGWVNNSTSSTDSGNWRIYTGTGNIGLDAYSFYVDNVALVTDSAAGNGGPNGFNIGKYLTTEFSECQVGFLMAYNRVLTAAEVQQNFNALRGRYGI